MESSGYEALIIGANILIFIVALSIAINLMVNVNELSSVANEMMTLKNDAMNVVLEDKPRTIKGQELVFYNSDEYTKRKYELKVKVGALNKTLIDYINSEDINAIITSNYTLEYGGKLGDKLIYIFTKI